MNKLLLSVMLSTLINSLAYSNEPDCNAIENELVGKKLSLYGPGFNYEYKVEKKESDFEDEIFKKLEGLSSYSISIPELPAADKEELLIKLGEFELIPLSYDDVKVDIERNFFASINEQLMYYNKIIFKPELEQVLNELIPSQSTNIRNKIYFSALRLMHLAPFDVSKDFYETIGEFIETINEIYKKANPDSDLEEAIAFGTKEEVQSAFKIIFLELKINHSDLFEKMILISKESEELIRNKRFLKVKFTSEVDRNMWNNEFDFPSFFNLSAIPFERTINEDVFKGKKCFIEPNMTNSRFMEIHESIKYYLEGSEENTYSFKNTYGADTAFKVKIEN